MRRVSSALSQAFSLSENRFMKEPMKRPLDSDTLGELGEKEFGALCARADLIANVVSRDRAGWDYTIDFRLDNERRGLDSRPAPISARVQVKTQWDDRDAIKLRLSSAEHLVKHHGPSFICVLSVDGELHLTRMRVILCRGEIVSRVLKRLREAEARAEHPANVWITIKPSQFAEATEPHHSALRRALEDACSAAHRRSVTALNEHGVVLLLGEPAAGKSTIGASLALAAADRWKCAVVKATSPESLEPRIDPDAKQFFWVDDAFGSTQFQHDRIERWNQLFPLMQAALTNGSKFLITSRDYIWALARKELKLSAFPSLRNSQVVIYTQQLSAAEKERILYNHIKLGDQPPDFKSQLKPLLRGLAARRDFLPETARRLGNRVFTKGLLVTADRVTSFFQHPRDFLEQTISTLAPGSRAAIGLLFLNGGLVRSPVSSELLTHPAEAFGATKSDTREQLTALDGSLLLLAQDDAGPYWTYRHPTVTDAFASFVGKDPELVEIYLRGARPENLIHEVVCAGVSIRGAMVTVPQSSSDMLVERIASLPRDSLKNFISARANKTVASRILACRPDIYEVLDRPLNSPIKEDSDAEFVVALHKLGLLPEDRRRQFFERVLEAVTDEADPSFIDNDDIAGVLTLSERAELIEAVRNDVLSNVALYIETQKDRWESNYDPEDYFEPLMAALGTFADAVGEDPSQLSRKILPSVNDAIDDLKARYYERQSERFDDSSRDFAPEPAGDLFRDVDE